MIEAQQTVASLFKPRKNLTGLKFTRLTVIECAGSGRTGRAIWRCRCDCGKTKIVAGGELTKGSTMSCGCLAKEAVRDRNFKHGAAKRDKPTNTYYAWRAMIKRCENPKNASFALYGGRGIAVCERWRNSYKSFLEDNGECPKGFQIDRYPDKNGNYEPGNTRWATSKQNNRNRRDNKIVTVRGITGCLAELCERFDVPYSRTYQRMSRGQSAEESFFG